MSRPGAPCPRFCGWVSPGRSPNRTCQSPSIRLSTGSCDRPVIGPSVQPGLDLQYPHRGLLERWRWCAGIHRRPPGIPVPGLRTRCLPFPCTRLSRALSTTNAPPHRGVISRRRTCPPPAQLGGGEGNTVTVPTFTICRLTKEVSNYAPVASPHLRRRHSVLPPARPLRTGSESTTTRVVVVVHY